VPEDTSLLELLRTMRRSGARRLPVVRADGVLAGLVTLDDILPLVAEQMQAVVEAIGAGQRREVERRP